MSNHGVQVAWPGADELGEGPVWDDRRRLLYRVDPLTGDVLAVDFEAGAERRYATGRPVGCIALREDDAGLLLGMRDGFGHLDVDDGTVSILARLHHDTALMQLNDGGCDPAGRFYAGSISRDASPGAGVLYRYQPPDGVCALMAGIGVSNGMAWDSAGTTFYFVDSLERRVDRFRYEPADGTLTDRRPAFDVSGFESPTGSRSTLTTACGWRSGAAARSAGSPATAGCSRRCGYRCGEPRAAVWADRGCPPCSSRPRAAACAPRATRSRSAARSSP